MTDAEVRSAYRRTALRCHPDKCTDLGAETAFVRVGQGITLLVPGGQWVAYIVTSRQVRGQDNLSWACELMS